MKTKRTRNFTGGSKTSRTIIRTSRPSRSRSRTTRSRRSRTTPYTPKKYYNKLSPVYSHHSPTTSSVSTFSNAVADDKKAADDFFNGYTMFTFDNSPESRAYVGIDHPIMEHISVNDYMNAIYYANADLINNRLKSKTEKTEEQKFTRVCFEKAKQFLPLELGDHHHYTEHTPTTIRPDKMKQTPILDFKEKKSAVEKSSRFNKMPKMQEEYLQTNAVTAGGSSATDRADSPGSPLVLLNSRLTYDKLTEFFKLSKKNENARQNWKHAAETFIKYMFFSEFEFAFNEEDNFLSGTQVKGKEAENYSFKLSTSSYRPHSPASSDVVVLSGPTNRIQEVGSRNISLPLNLAEVPPTLHTDIHTGATTMDMNVSMFRGSYRNISKIQQKHIIYSIILFILLHLDYPTLYALADDKWGSVFKIQEFIQLNRQIIAVIGTTVLPYSLFYTTFTNTDSTISGNIRMTPFEAGVDEQVLQQYFNFITHLYNIIMGNVSEDFTFKIESLEPRHIPGVYHPKIDKNDIPVNTHDIGMFYEVKNQDNVKFTPSAGESNTTGNGIFTGTSGIIGPQAAIFYEGVTNPVPAVRYMLASDIPSIKNKEDQWLKSKYISITPNHLTRRVWQVNSRITLHTDKILGHLSSLVYNPNDVIRAVSTNLLERDNFIYVGPFDHDPSYPYAFNSDQPSAPPQPSYSRVHVWLKTCPINVEGDHELYVVSRGSKTGYDWDSADDDILSGILNSERSLHMVNVLRGVIEYINSCFTDQTDPNKVKIFNALNKVAGGKSMQVFSSGHSLGGYLSMSLSHTCLATHTMGGISFHHISGVVSTRSPDKIFLKPYIIPIVFDPYIASHAIFSALSFLPYAHIHSCIDSDFNIDPPIVSETTRIPHHYTAAGTRWGRFPLSLRSRGVNADMIRYDDIASSIFLSYLRRKHSIQRFYDTMGHFKIYHYKNVYNVFPSGLYHDNYNPIERLKSDVRINHDLFQMVGYAAQYVFYHTPTKLVVRTTIGDQNLQTGHYSFPLPNKHLITPSYSNLSNTLTTTVQQTSDNDATDFHSVFEHDRSFDFRSRKRTEWLVHCKNILKKEIDDFVEYRE